MRFKPLYFMDWLYGFIFYLSIHLPFIWKIYFCEWSMLIINYCVCGCVWVCFNALMILVEKMWTMWCISVHWLFFTVSGMMHECCSFFLTWTCSLNFKDFSEIKWIFASDESRIVLLNITSFTNITKTSQVLLYHCFERML